MEGLPRFRTGQGTHQKGIVNPAGKSIGNTVEIGNGNQSVGTGNDNPVKKDNYNPAETGNNNPAKTGNGNLTSKQKYIGIIAQTDNPSNFAATEDIKNSSFNSSSISTISPRKSPYTNLSMKGNPRNPQTENNLKKVGSTFIFSNFKLNIIKNSIKSGINIGSKSSIIINIKDFIGKLEKSLFFSIDSIFYFKSMINIIPEIKELKTQKYTNICMFYINQFEDYPNKYLVYIYYNYKDLYFIYDINENKKIAGKIKTKIYDIGELEPYEIVNLLNKNINILKKINNPILPAYQNLTKHRKLSKAEANKQAEAKKQAKAKAKAEAKARRSKRLIRSKKTNRSKKTSRIISKTRIQ